MYVIRVENAAKSWGAETLFENVNFELGQGEKLVLYGRNGVGKSTLLAALAGHVSLDAGKIHRAIPVDAWGLLAQHAVVESTVTTRAFVQSGDVERDGLQRELAQMEQRMQRAADETDADMTALANRYGVLLDNYMAVDGYAWEAELEATLRRFGLPETIWEAPYDCLSGGQKTRAQLARLMLQKPSVLLLDEPTNHLDTVTLIWLERWIRETPHSVLMVTHDRYFIDHVADATLELTQAGTRRYVGGYSAMQATRAVERRTQQALFDKQVKAREALMEAIARYRQWYERAHQAAGERNPFMKKRAAKNATRFKAKERALERLEQAQTSKPQDAAQAQVVFSPGQFEASTLLQIENATLGYQEQPVLTGVNLTLKRGDRLAVVGENGAGKSTLLKGITKQLEAMEGKVRRHPQLDIGYFDQELARLDPTQTVLDAILQLPGMTQAYARTILAGFLFAREEVYKQIGQLSMGERCRVAFVRLYVSNCNLLVLDEPTNYLDVDTREHVEDALLDYPGTLVIVSHDRYLLSKLANCVLEVADGRTKVFRRTYDEYVAAKADPLAQEPDRKQQIQRLEYELAGWIQADADVDEREQEDRVARMRALRKEIARLKGEP
ncbi:ribosomal protection-like ABC-F family protein [Alicyclobacillus fodiniaquatilis]|uniref:Ribosomal protection-like ABC-F family protein n=1 Tax=Alicyclobacillus fodiniaquatilis TaxID=1661150 RepID=A0ABW4JET8_9BACL